MPTPLFPKGCKPGPGRPKGSKKNPIIRETEKIIKRYAKQRADTFLEAVESLMPAAVERVGEVVKRKGAEHAPQHLRALELLADRLYGRPAQAITGAGGGPLLVSFTQVLAGVDGDKKEKL